MLLITKESVLLPIDLGCLNFRLSLKKLLSLLLRIAAFGSQCFRLCV